MHKFLSLFAAAGMALSAAMQPGQPSQPPKPSNPTPQPKSPTPRPNDPTPRPNDPSQPSQPDQPRDRDDPRDRDPGRIDPRERDRDNVNRRSTRPFAFQSPQNEGQFNESARRLIAMEHRLQQSNDDLLRRLGEARQMTGERQTNALFDVVQQLLQEQENLRMYLVQSRTAWTGDIEDEMDEPGRPDTNPRDPQDPREPREPREPRDPRPPR